MSTEKRLTRRSAGESLSNLQKYRTSRDSPLNIIKEEPAAPNDSTASNVASSNSSSKTKSVSNKTESLKRRSEPVSTVSATPEPVVEQPPPSETPSAENQEKRTSRRIKDQKSVTSLVLKNVAIKTEPAVEAPTVVSSTPTIKFDLGASEPAGGSVDSAAKTDATDASIAGNLKMITRRRSSNLLRSGTTNSSTFLSQSLNLGKKRTLSNSIDLSASLKLNNEPSSSYLDYEDSNSSSAYILPSAASNMPTSSSSKRLKSKQSGMVNSPRPKDESKSNLAAEEENHSALGEQGGEPMDEDDFDLLKCPIRDCDSSGNLDGVSERHWTFDSCPRYFGINQDDCAERRVKLDKLSDEIEAMTKRTNENKKNLRNRYMSKDQLEYFKVVDLQLKNKVKSMHVSGEQQVSKPVSILSNLSASYPNLINDVKNLTTSFIIQSSLAHVAPAQASNNLLKPNPLISALTGLNKVDHAPSIDDLDVSEFDLNLFKDLLVMSASQKIDPMSTCAEKHLKLMNKNNKLIQFGNFEIETWYKSPYPDDVWQLGKMYICQYCLSYMKAHTVLDRHLEKCVWRHPPGREIYRQGEYSFFEVDGKYNKIYCQNLCLLAKLFLDHKTLYYDVEPFLFYILTKYDERSGSFEMMGYFSKEKQSVMNYNLSCILILPPYMNMSYGRLLIDFSYLLSRVEEKLGSPEKPLSDLGLVSYRSYWKSKLLEYLGRHMDDCEVSIKEISHETGILTNDIISTFQYIGLIKYWKGKHIIIKDKELLDKYIKKQYTYMNVDQAYLRWTPYVYQTIIDESESPLHNSKYSTSQKFLSEIHS